MKTYVLFAFTKNFFYLFKSSYKFSEKMIIFLYYVLFTVIFLCLPKNLHYKIKKIYFLGYKIEIFNFFTFHYLFSEVFVRNDYGFNIKSDSIILDAGADFGMTTLFFKWRCPTCSIYSFEPDPSSFSLLEKNIRKNNLKNVYIYNAALDKADGKTTFYKSAEEGSLLMSLDNNRMSGVQIEVETKDIANVISSTNVTHIKMDIEGYERILIPYLYEKNILQNISEMVIEYHHNVSSTTKDMSPFLHILEMSGFSYQLDTYTLPLISRNKFQDILIYAYK